MLKKTKVRLSYVQVIALSFIGVILLGSLLLSLPAASRAGEWTSYPDALFTSTSATCVTGLVVFDTYLHWSMFGQVVILCLIQIGGLGFMSIVTMVSVLLRGRIGLAERRLIKESTASIGSAGIVVLLKRVFLGTLIFEGAGALILTLRFTGEMPFGQALFEGVFYSVSAFCNAGFDLMGRTGAFTSLTGVYNDPTVVLTLAFLIIVGGLGFFVWSDLAKNRLRFRRLQLHSKVVLTATAVLLLGGTALFFAFEYNHAFSGMTFLEKLMSAFFASVTPRTAGFNTVPLAALSDSGGLLPRGRMFIGGSPGSTAGGVKTTTIVVMLVSAVAAARHTQGINLFKRRIEDGTLRKAGAIVTIYGLGILIASLLLCGIEPFGVKETLFEVMSAAGTVGLTMGITPLLSTFSQFVLMILMFGGRVGGLTLMLVLAEKREQVPLNRPVDKIIIG